MALVDKLRRAREQQVAAGGFTFTVRRPTFEQFVALRAVREVGPYAQYVVGWSGVRELDLYPGGGPEPVPFDADACAEWLSDRPDLAAPLMEAIVQSAADYLRKLETAEKN